MRNSPSGAVGWNLGRVLRGATIGFREPGVLRAAGKSEESTGEPWGYALLVRMLEPGAVDRFPVFLVMRVWPMLTAAPLPGETTVLGALFSPELTETSGEVFALLLDGELIGEAATMRGFNSGEVANTVRFMNSRSGVSKTVGVLVTVGMLCPTNFSNAESNGEPLGVLCWFGTGGL